MGGRKADLTLSFQVDKQKSDAAVKDVSKLSKSVTQLDKDLDHLKKTSGTTSTAVSGNLRRISTEQVSFTNGLLKGEKALKSQITVLDTYRQKLAAMLQAQGGSGGNVLARLGSTGSAVGSAISGLGGGQLGGLATAGGQISNAINQSQQLQGALGITSASLGSTAAAAGIAAPALIAASVAISEFSKGVEEHRNQVADAIRLQRQYLEIVRTSTSEEIKARLAELKAKRDDAQQSRQGIADAEDGIRKQFGIIGDADKALEDLSSNIAKTFGGQGDKHGGILAGFFNLQESAKSTDAEIVELNGQIETYTRALSSHQVALNDAKAAQEELTGAIDANRQKQDQVNQEIVNARQQGAQRESEILETAARRRVELAQQTARAEVDALSKLKQDLQEGAIRATQAQRDTLLSYHDEEARSAKRHANEMLKIKKDAEADEFDLLLVRDFAGLARQRRETDKRLREAEDNANQERAERLDALKIRLRDQQTAFIREREARQRALVQQLADIRTGLSRQLADNSQAARLELEQLQRKLQAEIALKQQANAVLLQIEQAYLDKRRQLVQQSVTLSGSSGLSGSQVHHMASGGFLKAGELSTVNEKPGQIESFHSGGRSAQLAGGLGLFRPLQSGFINPGRNGGQIGDRILNAPITIYDAQDPRKVGKIVEEKLSYALEKLAS